MSCYSVTSGSKSLVDPSWEYIDPTPDIFAMFQEFDRTFFGGTLSRVELKWSKRMTSCAGLMSPLEGKGGACSIRLSEPLLKLRPRKDLVETLLHEMIHAHLHVTKCRESDPHGPKFKEHMNRINKATGANITIYHNFIDEVNLHKQHWWRCNGPCQNWKPFYGWVKRATNRAPSKNDFWWERHRMTCGGQYIKVKEPEGYGKKKESKVSKTDKKSPMKNGNILAMIKKKYNLNKPKPTVISSNTTNKSEKSSSKGSGIHSPLKKHNSSVLIKSASSTISSCNTPESSSSFSKDVKTVGKSTSQSSMNNFLGQLHKDKLQRKNMSQTNGYSSFTAANKDTMEKKRPSVSESRANYSTSVVKKAMSSSSTSTYDTSESLPSSSKDAKTVGRGTSQSAMNNLLGQLHKDKLQRKFTSQTDGNSSFTGVNKRVSEKDSGLEYVEKKRDGNSSFTGVNKRVSEKDSGLEYVEKKRDGNSSFTGVNKRVSEKDSGLEYVEKKRLKVREDESFRSSKDTKRKLPINESSFLSEVIIDHEIKQNTPKHPKNSLKDGNELSSSSQTPLLFDKHLNNSSPTEKKTKTSVHKTISSSVNKEHSFSSDSSFHSRHKSSKPSTTVGKSPKVRNTLPNSDLTSTENKMNSHSTSKSLNSVNNSSIKNYFDCSTSDHLAARGSNNSNPIIIDNSDDSNSDIANVACPVCEKRVPENIINQHLDECLSMK
ncbi:sprT-like domain-containing protein Spartan isoform X1 [Octopus sinensis]|uniref:Protein with SprT-like domain at the N terminus n=1 Tax=Octopus sinensis TaxID=2607531 RepID=A0A6P7SZA4_9MOLL|nr:sprT-like domain-containing protein Spartan isoform X1 [Octopus sinensis]